MREAGGATGAAGQELSHSPPDRVPFLSLRLDALPAAVPFIRHRVLEFARVHGASPSVLARIGSAVTEAVANAVTHAYPDRDGFVKCDCDIENGVLEIIIADTGDGFTLRRSPGLGVGLAIVAGSCDDFGLVHGGEEPGVSVWMRFALY